MTISAKLQTINTALGDIKDAIINKGQTPSGNITTYATAISNIAGGGETIQATNQTGSNVSEGDKVWINKNGNTYEIVNYGTTEAVYDIVGSPIITNGVVSNFSSSNYLRLKTPFYPGSYSWEILFKVTTGSNFSNKPTIFGHFGGWAPNAPQLSIIPEGNLRASIPLSNGNEPSITGISCSTNTTYWFRLSFTGSQYKLEHSTDGQTFISDGTYSSSLLLKQVNEGFNIGFNYYGSGSTEYWNGTIDLNESYIKVRNELYWKPYRDILNITENSLTGIAAENIASGSSGNVMVVLPTPATTLHKYDRVDGKATVADFWTDGNGQRYAVCVVDAAYRSGSAYNFSGQYPDLLLPAYANSTSVLASDESGSYNTSVFSSSYPAPTFARNACTVTVDEQTFESCLPNAPELKMLYDDRATLDTYDPTLSSYSSRSLTAFKFGSSYGAWTSNQYSYNYSWTIYSGSLTEISSYVSVPSDCGVCPIIEIPVDENGTII